MAVSTSFSGAKLETFLLSNAANSISVAAAAATVAASPAPIGVFCKPNRAKKSLFFHKGFGSGLNCSIRCEASSEVVVQVADEVDSGNGAASSSAMASSLSALEQLKTSAADKEKRMSSYLLLIHIQRKGAALLSLVSVYTLHLLKCVKSLPFLKQNGLEL